MTTFIKEEFSTGSEYVSYYTNGRSNFIARFKYAKGSKAAFLKFLIKNFTVEEYFNRIAAGESPLPILQSKGFIQPHVKKFLKEAGYEVSPAGFEKYLQDRVAQYSKV